MGLDMTPEDRAKRLWEDYCITANPALLRVSIAAAIREALEAEREACALIAEARTATAELGTWQAQEGLLIAHDIRARV